MALFLRLACKMLELPETTKSLTQGPLAMQLISEPFHLAKGMETEFSAAIFLLVRENDHLAGFVAKLCRHLVDRHGDERLGAELVREIGRMHMPDNRCVWPGEWWLCGRGGERVDWRLEGRKRGRGIGGGKGGVLISCIAVVV